MTRLFRAGFAAHLALVVLVSVGAYTGNLPTSIPAVPHLDKLGHAILIGGLAFFLDGALEHRPLLRDRAFPRLGPVLVLVAAGIEEYAQRLSPRRSSDWADFAADVVGVCFFAWLSLRVARRHEVAASRPA
jgi:polysaccharide biosynthesis protein VpsQ